MPEALTPLARWWCVLALMLSSLTYAQARQPTPARVLDDFSDTSAWQAQGSDAVSTHLHTIAAPDGDALCLNFDFGRVSGYASARRTMALEIPANFEFSFRVRGSGPVNALQFKLLDDSGDNVWWMQRPRFAFADAWQTIRIRPRHLSFAWGPSQDRQLRRTAVLELTIAAVEGGRGEACFAQLELRELPLAPDQWPQPLVSASSARPDAPAALAIDGDPGTAWRSHGAGEQSVSLDFGAPREFGGITMHWLPDAPATAYEVQLSDDGEHWRGVRTVAVGDGGSDVLALGEVEARWLRLLLHAGPSANYGLTELVVEDSAFGADPNAMFRALAGAAPRGYYPRAFRDEQSYWTVVGVDGGPAPALLSEDGAVELAPGGFSLEPFLLRSGALITWADVAISHHLRDDYLPIPRVQWQRDSLRMQVSASAMGDAQASSLILRYTISNTGPRGEDITLALAVRPFQVNPPAQFLNSPGGVSPIHELAWQRGMVAVDARPRLFPLQAPDAFLASAIDAGSMPELLLRSALPQVQLPQVQTVRDPSGYASAALLYRLHVEAGGSASVALLAPLTGTMRIPDLQGMTAAQWAIHQEAMVAGKWRETLNRARLRLPPAAGGLADTVRTALAHVLINRDGPAIRPGTRAYARSWIRDGAMTASALLRLGHAEPVRAFVPWYAEHQFADGKVPCCVDRRGADPVPEHDSHGELIHAIAELYRYEHDRDLLARLWPHVMAAIDYLDALRASERTLRNRAPARRAYYGLMPPSISHEGYSDHPAYSYWDNFWALTGYNDALELASALGKWAEARRITRARDQFATDLAASLRASLRTHRIDFLPGAADRGDFDATSTTIALAPAAAQALLPAAPLRATFERYWREFVARRDGARAWDAYTPYEWRVVGALVRLGWSARAQAVSEFLLADRRPAGWNQWAEVVGRELRQVRFVGDMPHGWVASDFIRATLDRFAYVRPADHALLLAAGVPSAWLAGDGIAVEGVRTPFGELTYRLRHDGARLHLEIDAGLQIPPGGVVLAWPYRASPGPIHNDVQVTRWQGRELRVHALPARIAIDVVAD